MNNGLLETIFQRNCMLALRLGVPADRRVLTPIRQIGWTRRFARRRRRSALGGGRIGRERHRSGGHLSGRDAGRLYLWRWWGGRARHAPPQSRWHFHGGGLRQLRA